MLHSVGMIKTAITHSLITAVTFIIPLMPQGSNSLIKLHHYQFSAPCTFTRESLSLLYENEFAVVYKSTT